MPRPARGEAINVGIVVFCEERDYLGVRVRLDEGRLLALDPRCNAETVRTRLAALNVIASGGENGGVMAGISPADRFGWLTASAVGDLVQPSDVRAGTTGDPAATLEELFFRLVA